MTGDPFESRRSVAINEPVFSAGPNSPKLPPLYPQPLLQKIKSMSLPVAPPVEEEVKIIDFSPTTMNTTAIQRKLLICLSKPISDFSLKVSYS